MTHRDTDPTILAARRERNRVAVRKHYHRKSLAEERRLLLGLLEKREIIKPQVDMRALPSYHLFEIDDTIAYTRAKIARHEAFLTNLKPSRPGRSPVEQERYDLRQKLAHRPVGTSQAQLEEEFNRIMADIAIEEQLKESDK
jgi:hypothetical protein